MFKTLNPLDRAYKIEVTDCASFKARLRYISDGRYVFEDHRGRDIFEVSTVHYRRKQQSVLYGKACSTVYTDFQITLDMSPSTEARSWWKVLVEYCNGVDGSPEFIAVPARNEHTNGHGWYVWFGNEDVARIWKESSKIGRNKVNTIVMVKNKPELIFAVRCRSCPIRRHPDDISTMFGVCAYEGL